MDQDRHRRALLTAALGFAVVSLPEPIPPALAALRRWLNSWTGIGPIATGMARQGYDVELIRHNGRGWSASFWPADIVHWSPAGAAGAEGYSSDREPWQAVQQAVWKALRKD